MKYSKYSVLFFAFTITFLISFSQQKEITQSFHTTKPEANALIPHVDKKLELMCIACRLANIDGFTDTINTAYVKAIHQHFDKFSARPLIKYLNEIKNQLDTAYWQVQALAIHLNEPPLLTPLVAYDDTSADVWEDRTLLNPKTAALIQQFYKDAECDAFFKSQQYYYASISIEYKKQAELINKEWVQQFFGIPVSENYYAIITPSMQSGSYMRVNFPQNARNTYTIFGCASFDENGVPDNLSDEMYQRSMLHEYIHDFTNQLVDKNFEQLQKSAEIILANPNVWNVMKETFYGNREYLLYESMVRACTIKYLMTNEKDLAVAANEIKKQEQLGFFWMKGLVEQLNKYVANRNKYKNIEAFMLEIIAYFENTAGQMNKKSH